MHLTAIAALERGDLQGALKSLREEQDEQLAVLDPRLGDIVAVIPRRPLESSEEVEAIHRVMTRALDGSGARYLIMTQNLSLRVLPVSPPALLMLEYGPDVSAEEVLLARGVLKKMGFDIESIRAEIAVKRADEPAKVAWALGKVAGAMGFMAKACGCGGRQNCPACALTFLHEILSEKGGKIERSEVL